MKLHVIHHYEVRAVNHGLSHTYPEGANADEMAKIDSLLDKGHGYSHTNILYGCTECWKVFTKQVRGHWTIEQIRGGGDQRQ